MHISSGRWFLVFLSLFVSLTSFARQWPASKFEIPPINESFDSFGHSEDQELRPDSINILIWNMYKGDRASWDEDFPALAQGKDILMLQEAYLNPRMMNVLEQIVGIEFFMATSFLYLKDNRTKTGTMIGSRVLAENSYMMRTHDLEPIIYTPKTTSVVKLSIYGKVKKLLVINIHGLNLANHQAFVNHVAQALEKIRKHDGPIVYAGDFNTRTAARLTHLRKVLGEQGLTEVKWKNDRRKRWMGHPLDQAFIKNLAVKNAEVLGNIRGSDHKPMELQLSYPGQ